MRMRMMKMKMIGLWKEAAWLQINSIQSFSLIHSVHYEVYSQNLIRYSLILFDDLLQINNSILILKLIEVNLHFLSSDTDSEVD